MFVSGYCSGNGWTTMDQWETIVRRDLEEILAGQDLTEELRFELSKIPLVVEEVRRAEARSGGEPDSLLVVGACASYQALKRYCPERDGALDDYLHRQIALELARYPLVTVPMGRRYDPEGDARFLAAVQRLEEPDRSVVTLLLGLEGKEPLLPGEVGQLLGLSREEVRTRKKQALEQVRRTLGAGQTACPAEEV